MWTRAELKENAKKFFKFNYWKMVLVALVLSMVGGGGGGSSVSSYTTQRNLYSDSSSMRMTPDMLIGFIAVFLTVFVIVFVLALSLGVFLFNPLSVGAQRFFVVSHYQKAELGELGYAFSNSYMNVVKTMFLKGLFTSLWSLLFIIPGIIKGYEYRMIPYILAENPGIDSKEAFAISKKMMDGNKWDAFVLDLSFVGWSILSAFTCGILAVFYVSPYIHMTNAELYVALKEITFGNRNQAYQNYQGGQTYQNYQGDQTYQNYQGGQTYQNYQGDQMYQNYQDGQTYQNYQGDQTYQNYQGGQTYQNYQGDQTYQNYQGDQVYQNEQDGQGNQSYQDYQNNQDSQNY